MRFLWRSLRSGGCSGTRPGSPQRLRRGTFGLTDPAPQPGRNVTFTASGGSIATFRYAVLYNATPASGNLVGWWDYGTTLGITGGNSFQVQTDAVNGVLQLA